LLYRRAEISVKIWHYDNYIEKNCSRRENESHITGFTIFFIIGKIIDSIIMVKENGSHRQPLQPSKNDFAVHDFVKIFRINPAVIDSRYNGSIS